MSDKNDFDFDDDFFKDDNDEFDFGPDEEFPSGLDNNIDEDMPVIEEEPEERGTNRTFVVLALLLILLFIVGLGAVVLLATRDTGPTDAEMTATQVVMLNQTVEAQLALTQTQAAEFEFMTQTALAASPTPSPTLTFTPRPTVTPSPTTDITAQAATALFEAQMTQTALAEIPPVIEETETIEAPTAEVVVIVPTVDDSAALNQTATALALLALPTATPTVRATEPIEAINMTATAIAGAFQTATALAGGGAGGGDFPTPTQEVIGGPTAAFPTAAFPTALPDTGLFDDIAGGGRDGIGLLALGIVGLVGVIFISRRLRSSGTPPKDE